jgi:hypothetical protein
MVHLQGKFDPVVTDIMFGEMVKKSAPASDQTYVSVTIRKIFRITQTPWTSCAFG